MRFILLSLFCAVVASAKSPSGVYVGTVAPGMVAQFDFRKDGSVMLSWATLNEYGREEWLSQRTLYWRSSWFTGEIYLKWKKDDKEEFLNFVFEGDDLISKGRIGGLPINIRYVKRRSQ